LSVFKFQVLLPLLLIFLLLRKRNLVVSSILSASLCLLVSFALVGWNSSVSYAYSLMSMATSTAASFKRAAFPINMSSMPNLHGLFLGVFGQKMAPRWTSLITVLVSTGLLAIAAVKSRQREAISIVRNGLATAVVVSYYLFLHDLSVLLL